MNQEDKDKLLRSWQITRHHLECARTLLPSPHIEDPHFGSMVQYEEFLQHNELELGLDELEGLGKLNHGSPDFWLELAAAAKNMGLQDRLAVYEMKLTNFSESK